MQEKSLINESISQEVKKLANLLIEKKQTLTTAESCTGGGVSYFLTALSGSSVWFERGFVTYSNEAKEALIGVKKETLACFGAVSEAVAIEMAEGARKAAKADISLSITGIAGPDGGSKEKPVGTVCFAWVIEEKNLSQTLCFSGDREAVRLQAIEHAIKGCLQALQI